MRKFYRITDTNDQGSYVFPRYDFTETLAIPSRTAVYSVVGADGSYDSHGTVQSPLDSGSARIRFLIAEDTPSAAQSELDSMVAAVMGTSRRLGLRKLWRRNIEDVLEPEERWTYARPVAFPDIDKQLVTAEVSLEFVLPDPKFYVALTASWLTENGLTPASLEASVVPENLSPNLVFAEFTISSTPFTFSLTNTGNLPTQRIVFYLVSQGTNGFTNPKIENLTSGQEWSTSTDGTTSSHRLSVNCSPGLGRAQLSTNSGDSWIDDTSSLLLGSLQAVMMELMPGTNQLRYLDGGTPNLKLYVWWLHAYRD